MENNVKEPGYKSIEEYVNSLAREKGVNATVYGDFNKGVKTEKPPRSIKTAGNYKHFWHSFFSEFKDNVGKIEFLYQEKEKELPLSFGNKFLKGVGFNIASKTQEGEIKKENVNPDSIRMNVPGTDMINIITSESEWKVLNSLAKKSYGFSAPYVMMPEPLCYQVNIPLENIVDVRLKHGDFLNKKYKEKENVS